MSLTKEQKKIILGMARNIMHDYNHFKSMQINSHLYGAVQMMDAENELDFSQRRLEVYLETLVEYKE